MNDPTPSPRARGVESVTAVGRAPVVAAWGAGRDRWPRHICDWAARIATLAAGLCPTLSSLGGAVVGVLLAVATCAVGLRALAVVEGAAGPPRRGRSPRWSRSVVPVVLGAEHAALLQQRDHRVGELVEAARGDVRDEDEAVAGVGLHEVVDRRGDGGRGADEGLARR